MKSMLLFKKLQLPKNNFILLVFVLFPISQPIFAVTVEEQPEYYDILQNKVNFCLSRIGNSNPYVLAEIIKKSNLDPLTEITAKSHSYTQKCDLNFPSNKHEKLIKLTDDNSTINKDLKKFIRNWTIKNQEGMFEALSSNYFFDIQNQINLILSDLRDQNIDILKEIAKLTFADDTLALSQSSYSFLQANGMLRSFSLFETKDHLQDAKLYFVKNNRKLDPYIKRYIKKWFKYNQEDIELSFLLYGIFLLN